MKEINIAKVLINKRKEKGVTQDELASYIGVSKASVSKWETEQSYPDVTFLPLLAAYFNISVDELLDYKPQMTKEDIQKLYRRLSADFASKPFDTVMEECRSKIKKYYSCFPLLVQMGTLMINHIELIKDGAKSASILDEAKELFIRVKEESDDVSLIKKALYLEALCNLASGKPDKVLELLEDSVEAAMPPECLLASAYQMTGSIKEAESVLQAGIYQNLVVLFNFFPAYLMLSVNNQDKFEEVLKRAFEVSNTFDMKNLHPGVLAGFYIASAQGYMMQGKNEKAIYILQQYTDMVTGDIYPMKLHGDSFFDELEGWLDKLDIGSSLPRDEKTIRKSMADVITDNPAFAALSSEPQFKSITERLKSNIR